MQRFVLMLFVACVTASTAVADTRSEFCSGFSEGFKSIRGGGTIVPICPIPPITPIGSSPFREGLKAGVAEARESSGSFFGGGASPGSNDDFCLGFSEGYKSIKGDLTIVPICPIPPITPTGSTSFREGIKKGMAAARN